MLSIIQTTPVDAATDVSPNITIYVSFSKNLDMTTVNRGTVLLTNLDTNEVQTVEVTLSGNTIRVLPSMVMDEYTSYRVDLIGESADSPGGHIIAADAEALTDTQTISFQTGEAISASVSPTIGQEETITSGSGSTTGSTSTSSSSDGGPSAPAVDVDGDGVSDSTQVVEDASNDLTTAYENDLYLVDSYPLNGASDISPSDINSSGITLEFSRDVDEDTVADAIVIRQHPVAGLKFAGTSETDIVDRAESTSNDLFCIGTREAYTKPDYTLTVSNEFVFIAFDDDPIRLNSEVDIDIKRTLKSEPGDSGNKVFLKTATDVDFSTTFFPLYASVEEVRLQLTELGILATDEVINRYILTNSIRSWTIACRGFELCNPPFSALDYAIAKTVVDIFDMSQTTTVAQTGVSKRLGDFSISFSGQAGDAATPKQTVVNDGLKAIIKSLKDAYCNPIRTRVAIKGINASTTQQDFRTRTWKRSSYCPNRENTELQRQLRLPRITDLWS